jgi:hypothetical protein
MATETIIPTGWVAFVLDGKTCLGYQEFKAGGKYAGILTLITKPTEAELKAELKRLKITLPQ